MDGRFTSDDDGFNTIEVGTLPKACWWNLNQGWAYAPRTHQVKSAGDILATMKRVREAVGDLFPLNVGPRPWGDIHPDEQAVLREIGARLRACGCRSRSSA